MPAEQEAVAVPIDESAPESADLNPASVSTDEVLTFTATPRFCCSPLSIEFTLDESPLRGVASEDITWNFGDNRSARGRSVHHDFAWPGDYSVSVSARLGNGRFLTADRTVKLTVDDSGRLAASLTEGGTVPQVVLPVGSGGANPPAIELFVDAGPDVTIEGGELVRLGGRLLPTGVLRNIRVQWTQLTGRPVAASDLMRSRISFRAPESLPDPQILTFRFEAFAEGLAASDEVQVFVEAEIPVITNAVPSVESTEIVLLQYQSATLTMYGSDADNDDLTFSILVPPARGTLYTVDNSERQSARVVYVPPGGFVGQVEFVYRATDGLATSNAATFRIVHRAIGSTIQVSEGTYLVPMEQAVDIPIRATFDGAGTPTYSIVTEPTHGRLGPIQIIDQHNAVVRYTPFPRFQGADLIEYRAAALAATSSKGKATIAVRPRLIPWMEANSPHSLASNLYTEEEGARPGMTVLEYCMEGLNYWARVTDTIVITTTIGQVNRLYPVLMARKPPHVTIIGGLKTYTLPGAYEGDLRPYDYADSAEWEVITHALERIHEITGSGIVVLENETALKPYFRGQAGIDFDRLADAWIPLAETGLTTWSWLPWIESNTTAFPDREEQSTEFVGMMANALPNNVFMTDYASWPGWETSGTERARRDAMRFLVSPSRVQDGLFVTMTGRLVLASNPAKECFTPSSALAQLPRLAEKRVRIYPGAANWVLVGRAFATELPPLAPVVP
jgi:hypothetical protein